MAEISTLQSSALYFSGVQSAASQQAKNAQKSEKSAKNSKISFASSLKKAQEEKNLISEGLPPEIAGMSGEEAVIFLKDAVDIAGDELQRKQDRASIDRYREKVSQFIKFIVKNNYEVVVQQRKKFNPVTGKWEIPISRKSGKPVDPRIQIRVINEKLNQFTSDFLYNHRKNLNMLARIEEINGLIVDLLAG